jgi:membrane fusion protein (multidrug efflux system)
VEVSLERIPEGLTVPTESLVPDIQGQKVFVLREGKVTSQRVDVGIRLPKAVQLTSGVQAGDTVLVTGLLAVREGMPVKAIAMEATPTLNGAPAGNTGDSAR